MDAALQKMQERLSSLDSRVNRLRTEIESVEAERADVQVAIRVYSDVTGEIAHPAAENEAPIRSDRPASEKRELMLALLGVGEASGKSPAQVHKGLLAQNIQDISIEVVRTTLWRAANRDQIGSGGGQYWKLPEAADDA